SRRPGHAAPAAVEAGRSRGMAGAAAGAAIAELEQADRLRLGHLAQSARPAAAHTLGGSHASGDAAAAAAGARENLLELDLPRDAALSLVPGERQLDRRRGGRGSRRRPAPAPQPEAVVEAPPPRMR